MTRLSFDREISDIIRISGEVGGVAEEMVRRSIPALIGGHADEAREIIEMDMHADQAAQAIDAAVFRALALQQPQASDLRQMLALLQASASIERIADHAKNIARGVLKSARHDPRPVLQGWEELGALALNAVGSAINALCRRDAEQAFRVWEGDAPIDQLCDSLSEQILAAAEENPKLVRQATQFVVAAKHYERIGDQATNIAENVIFLVRGRAVTEIRPRG